MKRELRPIAEAMFSILADPRSNRVERIECAKVLLSLYGQFIPDVNESFLSVRQLTQLRQVKQQIVEKVLRRKVVRKKANRRAYLRRTLNKLEATQRSETA